MKGDKEMERCSQCGQLNEDYEDYCIYCGEAMFIQVDHENTTNNVRIDHLYADSIARELIDENTTVFDDDDDLSDVTKELLSEDEDDDTFIMDTDEFFFDEYEDEKNEIKDEKLIQLENQIKTKIRRNKKLESGMGLVLRNIDIILDDFNGPLEIMGEITTNDKLDNKSVQLSAISYNIDKKMLNKAETIIKVDHGNYKNFSLSLNLNIKETAIIIIVPEMIRYDNTDEPQEEVSVEKQEIPNTGSNIFIEQLHDIERKISMEISNTAVLVKNDSSIEIVGEIRIENPDKYHNIKIAATCYDNNNKIIGTESTQINTRLFLGFDTLSLKIDNINVDSIQRIRLYPTLQ